MGTELSNIRSKEVLNYKGKYPKKNKVVICRTCPPGQDRITAT